MGLTTPHPSLLEVKKRNCFWAWGQPFRVRMTTLRPAPIRLPNPAAESGFFQRRAVELIARDGEHSANVAQMLV